MLHTTKHKPGRGRRGFSLVEAMVAVLILGVSVTALMTLMGSGTRVSAYAQQMGTATFLAEQLRARTDNVAFANLAALNGATFTAQDADGNPIAGLDAYQQQLVVTFADPGNPAADAAAGVEVLARLTALITYNGQEITRISWLRAP